jgi:hypothetical protein
MDTVLQYLILTTPFFFSLFSVTEVYGLNMGYSKFAHGSKLPSVPSKVGMFILYFPSACVAAYAIATLPHAPERLQAVVVAWMLFLHFLKRCLEVLFLHRFSGETRLFDAIIIAIGYVTITAGSLIFGGSVSVKMDSSALYNALSIRLAPNVPFQTLCIIGFAIFLVGELGNLYHHWILANLRTNPGSEKRYFVPQGGLFFAVTCPHYFFEVIAFMGVASATTAIYCYLIAFAMFSYLSGRSYCTKQWYLKKIAGFPEDRKLIIPFVL